MHALVERAANGDDEALFMAVLVDRAVVQAEPIAQRICHAQMLGDESFMNQLAKAITRTKPRRPSQEYDDLRLILQLLDEASGLDTSTDEELYQLLVEDLELYPDDRKDPLAGLKKLIQKRKRVHGK